ncbi:hypothetical protein ACHAPT_013607 [Fusarium lateritium]
MAIKEDMVKLEARLEARFEARLEQERQERAQQEAHHQAAMAELKADHQAAIAALKAENLRFRVIWPAIPPTSQRQPVPEETSNDTGVTGSGQPDHPGHRGSREDRPRENKRAANIKSSDRTLGRSRPRDAMGRRGDKLKKREEGIKSVQQSQQARPAPPEQRSTTAIGTDNLSCANYGSDRHDMAHCLKVPEGSLKGCILCNTKDHNVDECLTFKDMSLRDQVSLLVYQRRSMPPLQTKGGKFTSSLAKRNGGDYALALQNRFDEHRDVDLLPVDPTISRFFGAIMNLASINAAA